jgi:aryl-alcohol dehydrogenase-like predicted oxidoreductase
MNQPLAKNILGRTGLEITRLGYGAMEIRGGPRGREVSDEDAGAILNEVLDAGINFIDTSIDYGRSEELIGEHISHRRSEFYLASKCGCAAIPEANGDHVFTRENIVAGVEQSLKRMRTDHLDIVQFHSSPSKATLRDEDSIKTLLDLKEQGKIRFLGSSSTLPNLADHVSMGVFDEFQIPYSGLSREHEDWITKAADAGIGTVIRGGVAKGQPGEGGGVINTWAKWDEAELDALLEVGESRTAFMLRFTLTHPGLHTTIVGTKNPVHLRENITAAGRGPLSPDTYAETKRRLDAAGVTAEPA